MTIHVDAIVFDRPLSVTTGRFALPEQQPDQLLVKTIYTYVSSGTETRVWAGHYGAAGKYPLIPGYACVGRVEAVGAAAAGYRVGDLVAYCPRSSDRTGPLGITSMWGGQASAHLIHAASEPVVLPAGVDPLPFVLGPVLGIPLRGATMTEAQPGETAVVVGLGVIGLGVVASLVAAGCRVVVVDRAPSRLARARELGAWAAVEAGDDAAARVLALIPGGADICVEATGVSAGLELVHRCVRHINFGWTPPLSVLPRRLPRILYQANYLEPITIAPDRFFPGEGAIILTPFDRGTEDQHRAAQAIASGRIDARRFIDRVVPWREAAACYADLRERPDACFSAVFRWE